MSRWFLLLLLISSSYSFAQKDVTTFGIQIKPIIPSNLFQAGDESVIRNDIEYHVNQRVGYSFGGVIRRGVTDWFSMETGISYVRRNFRTRFTHEGFPSDTMDFRVIGYEIPVMGMVYVKLADQVFMDAAFGVSMDMFPTNVGTRSEPDFSQLSVRRRWIQSGLLANVGWEFRTKEKGYFYVGASYHRPFQSIYLTRLYYRNDIDPEPAQLGISGNYLTIDLRYFFHEDPQKREKKEKRDPDSMPQWMRK